MTTAKFKFLSWHFSGGSEKKHKNFNNNNSRSLVRDSKPEPDEYESGVPTTTLQRWVSGHAALTVSSLCCKTYGKWYKS